MRNISPIKKINRIGVGSRFIFIDKNSDGKVTKRVTYSVLKMYPHMIQVKDSHGNIEYLSIGDIEMGLQCILEQ